MDKTLIVKQKIKSNNALREAINEFYAQSSFSNFDATEIRSWDVSEVTDMNALFLERKFVPDISSWNVENVTDMKNMFEGCQTFLCDLKDWNVGKVVDMSEMFYRCKTFNMDLSKWDTKNVKNMDCMFYKCNRFNSDLSKWDVGNVNNMRCMFAGCKSLNQDFSKWNVSKVTIMREMFIDCFLLNFDLSNWDVRNVKDHNRMFHNCEKFEFNSDNVPKLWYHLVLQKYKNDHRFLSSIESESDENHSQSEEEVPPLPKCDTFASKTAVLVITTHGEIMFRDDQPTPRLIKTPVKLTLLEATPIGGVNFGYSSPKMFESICKFIQSKVSDLSSSGQKSKKGLEEIVEKIKSLRPMLQNKEEIIKKIAKIKTNIQELIETKKKFDPKNPYDKEILAKIGEIISTGNDKKHFLKNASKAFAPLVLKKDQFLANKLFTCSVTEYNDSDFDNKILFITENEICDYLSGKEKKNKTGDYKASVEELTTFSQTKGIDHLVVFDFSCFSFSGKYRKTKTHKRAALYYERMRVLQKDRKPLFRLPATIKNVVKKKYKKPQSPLVFYSKAELIGAINEFYLQQLQEGLQQEESDDSKKLKEINSWDVSSVDDMSFLFADRGKVPNIGNWNVSNVKNMEKMFHGCDLSQADLSRWIVKNVTNMSGMFKNCVKLKTDISKWSVKNVTNMSEMFYSCSGESLQRSLNYWNVVGVTNMSDMFANCEKLQVDISEWNVSNVRTMDGMFYGCQYFNMNLSNWKVNNIETMSGMFHQCKKFNQALNTWNVENVKDTSFMFSDCESFNRPLNSWKLLKNTNASYMFCDCKEFNRDLKDWEVSTVTKMNHMFSGCVKLNQDFSKWDVSRVTNMEGMFYNCQSLNTSLVNWNVSNVTDHKNVLFNCKKFQFTSDNIPRVWYKMVLEHVNKKIGNESVHSDKLSSFGSENIQRDGEGASRRLQHPVASAPTIINPDCLFNTKTVVLMITTHGSFDMDNKKLPKTCVAPLNVIQVLSVLPGEMSFELNRNSYTHVLADIQSRISRLHENPSNETQLKEVNAVISTIKSMRPFLQDKQKVEKKVERFNKRVNELIKTQKVFNKNDPAEKEIIKEIGEKIRETNEMKAFVKNSKFHFKFVEVEKTGVMLDKNYSCDENDNNNSLLTNKILVVGNTGVCNLLSFFDADENGEFVVSLETIMAFFAERGVSKLILFDFSCFSSFETTKQKYNKRALAMFKKMHNKTLKR